MGLLLLVPLPDLLESVKNCSIVSPLADTSVKILNSASRQESFIAIVKFGHYSLYSNCQIKKKKGRSISCNMTTLAHVSLLTDASDKIAAYNELLKEACTGQLDVYAFNATLETIFAEDSLQLIERPIIQHIKVILADVNQQEDRQVVLERVLHVTDSRRQRLEDELWSMRYQLAMVYEAQEQYAKENAVLKSIQLDRGLDEDEKLNVIIRILSTTFKLRTKDEASDLSSCTPYINIGKECLNERTDMTQKLEFWKYAARASYGRDAYSEAFEFCTSYLNAVPDDSSYLEYIVWSAICASKSRSSRGTVSRVFISQLLATRSDAIRSAHPALHTLLVRLDQRQFIPQAEIQSLSFANHVVNESILDNNLAFIARTFKNISIDQLSALLGTTQRDLAELALEAQGTLKTGIRGYIDQVHRRVIFEDDDEASIVKSNEVDLWDAHIKLLCTAVDRAATAIESL